MEKRPYKSFLGKLVVTKEGKRLGTVKDITFETRTGELINLILKDLTSHALNLAIEKTKNKEALIPYHSVIAIGDFIVVSEEDLF
ncbi:MAG: PRC-barrel domain-containing protein [Candidatus Pacearchaeota archaeon]